MTWAVAATHPCVEARVAGKLEAAGLVVRLFWVKTTTVLHGALVNHFRPAFPRYLFVKAEERWREILEVVGVVGFLRDLEGYPARIGDVVVDDLLQRSTTICDRTVLVVPPRASKFHFGDNVQIVGNSLISGRKGIFQQLSGETHGVVLIEVMGRHVPFRVPESELILTPLRVPKKKKPHGKSRKPFRVGTVVTPALIVSAAV